MQTPRNHAMLQGTKGARSDRSLFETPTSLIPSDVGSV
jgi:hypothetical protein